MSKSEHCLDCRPKFVLSISSMPKFYLTVIVGHVCSIVFTVSVGIFEDLKRSNFESRICLICGIALTEGEIKSLLYFLFV